MKNLLIILLAISTAALGAFCVWQMKQDRSRQAELELAREELKTKTLEVDELQTARQRAEQQQLQLLGLTSELGSQIRSQQVAMAQASAAPKTESGAGLAAAESDDAAGGLGKMLSKMMQDPDTKKFIRDQQRMMMDQLYAPLVKQLGLTQEEGEKFKGLLAENMMRATEKATSLFGGSGTADRTEALNTLKGDQKQFEDQIKAFLGDTRYAQYQDYQQTVGERAQLSMFKQQTAGSEHPLTDQQTEQLLAVMREEKQNATTAFGQSLPGSGQDEANLEMMMDDQKLGKVMEIQDTVNQKVFQRASTILSPDQMESFGRFQTNQVQMMRMGMSMARKMFGGSKGTTGGTVPGQ